MDNKQQYILEARNLRGSLYMLKCQYKEAKADFDYILKFVNSHPDFKVKSSLTGTLKSNTDTKIIFSYKPTIPATAEATVQFSTSEFDFKPKVIRLIASC